jgi:hypothetical protein
MVKKAAAKVESQLTSDEVEQVYISLGLESPMARARFDFLRPTRPSIVFQTVITTTSNPSFKG